ncbi:NOI protein, nitrate-induced [Musa troglodytarum]|uniref:NOI protein, nitrate-induced n=1 Tax=Musa troglodytarum TaxID=320322 RepID=A0A9E7HAV6_9LILI|nr:NOI protein, nitrate-induced [Musa troglodytarum]
MMREKGQPLPKFGEWDVNNPASAEGFTVIFNKVRDEKKTGGNSGTPTTPTRKDVGSLQPEDTYRHPTKTRKWFCCG